MCYNYDDDTAAQLHGASGGIATMALYDGVPWGGVDWVVQAAL